MSRTFHDGSRRVRVRGVRRNQPDLRKLGRALLDIAQAELEAEAQAEHRRAPDNVIKLPARPTSDGPERDAA